MTAELGDVPNVVVFVQLFTDSARRIYGYILAILPDEEAAGDVFQDVSVTLWERFDRFQPGTDFYAWAKQIAYYKVLNYRERKRRDRLFVGDAVLAELAIESDEMADLLVARHRALADCFRKLSETDRDLIERRYAPGTKTENLAGETGRSLHQLYRALRRIHQALFDCVNHAISAEGR